MENIFKQGMKGGAITLLASRSRAGGKGMFPRIPTQSPVSGLYEDIELCGPASLYSYTVIHPNPKSGKSPFVLALVDFAGETRVFGRLNCPTDAVQIGMSVQAYPDPDGETSDTAYHFVPVGEARA
ncbi:OB-fold domain-containing protein [Sulfitobacter sp. PR48]|uniref:Zn-ribbon domain-containing OB-fold protein n=1 Tax=Sulfitobacter sp. PR48 TaxID=3028383 RepID=UPI00237A4836|nr:OB-fold domain-containing protein [Sulfitobacter sp. PR48]MDD9723602.1 OB-fold domain-containing protein [Sulfitobacter sp. PR48]|tara:strand:- start:131 stop:508 length:378 start_codon:yes stop_codon:yes gene_type:complete